MTETAAFDAVATAKTLLRTSLTGALSTLMPGSGDPYGSLVNVATETGGAPILLISRLAVHTRNILADSRVSLLLDERDGGDAMALTRIMIGGRAQPVEQPAAAIWRAIRTPGPSSISPISASTGSSRPPCISSPASAASRTSPARRC